jgi:hypothetical protein
MSNATTFRATWLIACAALLLFVSNVSAQTRPDLGTASTYAVFTGGGAINNTGLTALVGDVGQDGAYAFNGFPPGTYTGTLNRNNAATALAKADLLAAWTTEAAVACGTVLGTGIVDGQSFSPGVYCSGGATTATGNITFNAQGDPNAIFIVKIGGQLDVNAGTHILLSGGARASNIYWFVDGAVNVADNSSFKGTIIARGAISFAGTSSLDGRALAAPAGAITLSANNMSISTDTATVNNIIVVHPASGDTIRSGSHYQVTWSGSGIANSKILQYSLDGGLTWIVMDTINSGAFSYNWSVPDTVSSNAVVRITDQNQLVGVSGHFVISAGVSPGTLTVTHPTQGETILAGSQNYQITWSGSAPGSIKTFELSLDGGLTWMTIGSLNSDATAYGWNVPDTVSALAKIRITDNNGLTGTSAMFAISRTSVQGSIVVVHPMAGEVIAGGSQNYQITFTATNTTSQKRLDYSLDGGATWNLIGFMNSDALSYTWSTVPNVATTQALVRITDANGVTGTSGLFTITSTPGVGSLNSLTLTGLDSRNNIGNNRTLGISWTLTPNIGNSVRVEVSLDGMATWTTIANNPVSDTQTYWMTTYTGYYYPVYVRVTSSEGMSLTSIPFSIGSSAAVTYNTSKNGYSVSNYPNPATSQTTINTVLPVSSDVTLTIFDDLGRSVKVLTQRMTAGSNSLRVNTSDLVPGTYAYTIQAGSVQVTGHLTIVQ